MAGKKPAKGAIPPDIKPHMSTPEAAGTVARKPAKAAKITPRRAAKKAPGY